MLAYCWDLESNVYHERKFTVKHWRDKRGGGVAVTDERDIYEVTFNAGARRLRSCILECIPAHIKDEAESAVHRTLKRAAEGVPIKERLANMVTAFGPLGVNETMIEDMLGHKLSVISEIELTKLRQAYRGIIEGQGKVEDFFKPAIKAEPDKTATAKKTSKKKASKKKASKKTGKKTAAKPAEDETPPEETIEDTGPGMNFNEIFKAVTMTEDADELAVLLDATNSLAATQRESLKVVIKQKLELLQGDDREPGEDDDLGLE